jgi:murein DD-endopeptidase MepM/ murein hydrolase activator NlpD
VVVQPGDTLAALSTRTGVPVATIAAANGLKPTSLLFAGGQLLLAPRNSRPVAALARCPVPGAQFMDDWGFTRSDTGFHQGNDMMAKRGTPVAAPVSGTVSDVVGSIGGNQFQLVASDGTVYYGAHLDRFGKTGKVKAGDTIGYVGDTGDAKGGPTHLHFEIHPGGGAAVNPYQTLVAACR